MLVSPTETSQSFCFHLSDQISAEPLVKVATRFLAEGKCVFKSTKNNLFPEALFTSFTAL